MYSLDFKEDLCSKYSRGVSVVRASEKLMIQSVDFITPVVDDPYVYGQIAAANALSDIFAMGGQPCVALNVLMWDKENVPQSVLNEIFKGGLSKLEEANVSLLGGHSVVDKEQKYGFCVTGFADKIWRNNTPRVGDALILSKPIGSGIITTALKNRALDFSKATECIESMRFLNMYASKQALDFEIHAATDITGFGLLGHLVEMCKDTDLELFTEKIPIFPHVQVSLDSGFYPSGSKRNQDFFSAYVNNETLGDDRIFYDAQTSGGIVFALPFEQAEPLLDRLHLAGYHKASIIGRFCARKHGKRIFLR